MDSPVASRRPLSTRTLDTAPLECVSASEHTPQRVRKHWQLTLRIWRVEDRTGTRNDIFRLSNSFQATKIEIFKISSSTGIFTLGNRSYFSLESGTESQRDTVFDCWPSHEGELDGSYSRRTDLVECRSNEYKGEHNHSLQRASPQRTTTVFHRIQC
jgi:hypothetical protein